MLAIVVATFAFKNRERGSVCIADSIPTLQLVSASNCAGGELWGCRVDCFARDAAACLGLAYETQKDPKRAAETITFFRRACLLGAANACTNYAATIWTGKHTDVQLACARRTFEKACAADESFACGMVGRLMIEDTTPPRFAEGRRYLESACDRVGGFPCRVLAKHLESGKLGTYKPGLIHTLLARACADGDSDACGEPATAAQTFH